MVYGYARCSTNEERQDIDRQKRELYSLGVKDDKFIYWEKTKIKLKKNKDEDKDEDKIKDKSEDKNKDSED